MSKSNNQAIRASPYQICAHQAFACQNRPNKRASRPPVRKTQKSGQSKPSHAPPRAAVSSGISPTRHIGILTGKSSLVTRIALSAFSSTALKNSRFCPPFDLTRAPLVSSFFSCHAQKHYCWCHLTSPDDVITQRHQPCKHVHVSPSPRQCHVIRMSQRLCSPIRDRPEKPRTDPDHVSDDFDPRLVDFDFDFLR